MEAAAKFNRRLDRDRKNRLPFLESQTQTAQTQNNILCVQFYERKRLDSSSKATNGQIYAYPLKRWSKHKRYLTGANDTGLLFQHIHQVYLQHKSHAASYLEAMNEPQNNMHLDPFNYQLNNHNFYSGTSSSTSFSSVPPIANPSSLNPHLKHQVPFNPNNHHHGAGGHVMMNHGMFPPPVNHPTQSHAPIYTQNMRQNKEEEWNAHNHQNHNHDDNGDHDDESGDEDFEDLKKRKKKPRKKRGEGIGPAVIVNGPAGEEKVYICEKCGMKYKTRPGLTYHVQKGNCTAISQSYNSAASAANSAHTHNHHLSIMHQNSNSNQARSHHDPDENTVNSVFESVSAYDDMNSSSSYSNIAAAQKKESISASGGVSTQHIASNNILPNGCFVCGKAEMDKSVNSQSEKFVNCSECPRLYHTTCLNFSSSMISSIRKYSWQCVECKS
jgi:hypothetical protein